MNNQICYTLLSQKFWFFLLRIFVVWIGNKSGIGVFGNKGIKKRWQRFERCHLFKNIEVNLFISHS